MTQTATIEKNHAIENARNWFEIIQAHILKINAAVDAEDINVHDTEMSELVEGPLSVMVRGGWHEVGKQATDQEYEILLSTGGPALRIVGELNNYNQPQNAELQWQDWGTPWTVYSLNSQENRFLVEYANCFYFG